MLHKKYSKLRIYSAIGLLIFGCMMLTAGVAIHPYGEIHSSILIAFGEVVTLAGALFGVHTSIKSGKLQVDVEDEDSDRYKRE